MIKEIDYTDQVPYYNEFGDRALSATYTPHGIKCIDSEFCARIRKLDNKITEIVQISVDRMLKSEYPSKWDKKLIESGVKAELTPMQLNNKEFAGYGNELKITWDDGTSYEFFYWDRPLKIDLETGCESLQSLREDIVKNPHLHFDIKENLLSNLESYLQK